MSAARSVPSCPCPTCGKSFKNLAEHTFKTHTTFEVKWRLTLYRGVMLGHGPSPVLYVNGQVENAYMSGGGVSDYEIEIDGRKCYIRIKVDRYSVEAFSFKARGSTCSPVKSSLKPLYAHNLTIHHRSTAETHTCK
jgi:hypothetical protein